MPGAGNDSFGTTYDSSAKHSEAKDRNKVSSPLYRTDIMSATYDFDRDAKIRGLRYGRSYATFNQMVESFDVSRIPDLDNTPMPYVGHIIFTRPSLFVNTKINRNAVDDEIDVANANFEALTKNSITAGWINDTHGRRLIHMLSEFSTTPYMPIFSNRAFSYSVGDVSLKTIEKGHTFFGHFIKYGKHSEDHKHGSTMSIDFRNDYQHSIMTAVWLWMAYIMIVSKTNTIQPAKKSQHYGILDYAASIYYLVTRADLSEIVYWEKLTGVFPKNLPLSMFSYSGAMWTEDKLSIEFDYAIRSDPKDPNVLFDLNVLSSTSYSRASWYTINGVTGEERPNYKTNQHLRGNQVRADNFKGGGFGLGPAFAACPVIHMRQMDDGTTKYYLQWARYIL